jgi:hypothetical protein
VTTADRRARSARGWAIGGGAVLLAGVIAIIIGAITNQPPVDPTTPPAATTTDSPPTSASPPAGEDVVDDAASDFGWRGEPITTDATSYAAAALEAASTFDTTKSTRDRWLDYLDTWFTPDTRYTSEADQQRRMAAAKLELRQGVVLPQVDWESLVAEDGRVVAAAREVALSGVTDDPPGDMAIGTADVVLTFTRTDGSGVESSYEESVRVSVQVLCGPESVPTPDSAQQAGDCKVVRFFTEPVEP